MSDRHERHETAADLDEADVARLWTGIGSRRRARARARHVGQVVGGGLIALVVAFVMWRPPSLVARVTPPGNATPAVTSTPALAAAPTPSPEAPGPLHLAGGAAPTMLAASADQPARFVLEDRSVVELAKGARLEVRANTATAFTARLEGSATVEVTPGGPRRWSIVASLVTVDVIGTRFAVREVRDEGGGAEDVTVAHGVVLVRGAEVPGHVVRLVDGQSVHVSAPSGAARAAAPGPHAPSSVARVEEAPRWRDLAEAGDYDGAYRELGGEGVSRETAVASVDDLFHLADVARLSAHGADAVLPLSRIVEQHASDARAPVAAFTLGRLELDTLGRPAAAATAFAKAIALGLPDGLVEDAYARLVEAQVKAGALNDARGVRATYAEKFPGGARSSTMDRWISTAAVAPSAPPR